MPTVDAFFEHTSALTSGKKPLQILCETRELLSVEQRWTQGARARDVWKNPVRPEDPTAVAWCIEGAVAVVCNPFGITPFSMLRLLDKVVSIVFHTEEEITVSMYNELMYYEAIVCLLDEAILIEEIKTSWNRTQR